MSDIDKIYKDGNVKIREPEIKKEFSESDIKKIIKEHIVLNKQYNSLLIETNTLRKRSAFQDNNVRKLTNQVNMLENSIRSMEHRMNTLLTEIEAVYAKLGKK